MSASSRKNKALSGSGPVTQDTVIKAPPMHWHVEFHDIFKPVPEEVRVVSSREAARTIAEDRLRASVSVYPPVLLGGVTQMTLSCPHRALFYPCTRAECKVEEVIP